MAVINKGGRYLLNDFSVHVEPTPTILECTVRPSHFSLARQEKEEKTLSEPLIALQSLQWKNGM
jgi:hypothetical protein